MINYAVQAHSQSSAGIELQAWAAAGAAPLMLPAALPDTTSEDCNFDADSFRLVHCRLEGPVPAQVWDACGSTPGTIGQLNWKQHYYMHAKRIIVSFGLE